MTMSGGGSAIETRRGTLCVAGYCASPNRQRTIGGSGHQIAFSNAPRTLFKHYSAATGQAPRCCRQHDAPKRKATCEMRQKRNASTAPGYSGRFGIPQRETRSAERGRHALHNITKILVKAGGSAGGPPSGSSSAHHRPTSDRTHIVELGTVPNPHGMV